MALPTRCPEQRSGREGIFDTIDLGKAKGVLSCCWGWCPVEDGARDCDSSRAEETEHFASTSEVCPAGSSRTGLEAKQNGVQEARRPERD